MSIYLQLENINNAFSKQSNPDIKLTYAQVSLQVLTSLYLQDHVSSQFPHHTLDFSHIQHMYSRKTSSWISVPLQILPLCLENTFTPFHLVIYFRCFRTQLRCLYLKAPLPHLLAFRLTNASPPYYHSPVRFVYCEPNHHINGKINLILLSSFSFLVLSHQQLISF